MRCRLAFKIRIFYSSSFDTTYQAEQNFRFEWMDDGAFRE